MKNARPKFIAWRTVLLAMAAIIAVAGSSVHGKIYDYFDPGTDYSRGYSLLIEQNPIEAGKITPGLGIYKAESDEVVTLRAIANPGYQFVFWLGDVTDPTTNETTVLVDSPKIVIAVFERSDFELPLEIGIVSGIGKGGHRWVPDFRPRRGVSATNGNLTPLPIPPIEPPEPLGYEFPVPAEPFPVPESDEEIPEPATVILFGLGGLSLFSQRRQRKRTS
ncbi:MAG: InlB B-repeat-containing protein [Planctomycetota bacterium]|jgi:hypothetical protein